MSVGTSVFLSAVLLACILLFGFTKDRWNWRKIFVRGALLFVALVILVVVSGAVVKRRIRGEIAKREADTRRLHQVKIGDRFRTVLQRQGSPDTVFTTADGSFVAGYWPDYKSATDADKAFFFDPDSTLSEIRFMGEGFSHIEYAWTPEDGVTLGMARDSIALKLGEPCRQEIDEYRTLTYFSTADPTVARFVSVSHGAGLVIRHGWVREDCEAT